MWAGILILKHERSEKGSITPIRKRGSEGSQYKEVEFIRRRKIDVLKRGGILFKRRGGDCPWENFDSWEPRGETEMETTVR